ncbi:MAG TPA: BON domain-containing protein [Polyangiaceae bacterium]
MKSTILIIAAMAAMACDRSERTGSEDTDLRTEVSPAERSAADDREADEPAAADNTKKNERDLNEGALTPGDQGESEGDRTITQQVRKGIVGHDGLSTTAENVKIITVDGVVTLRGPVKSAQERSTIASVAQGVEGVKRVDNHLEVASQ